MQAVETWFDPVDMFRQIAPKGIVTKQSRNPIDLAAQLDAEVPPTDNNPPSHSASINLEKSEKSDNVTVDGLKKMFGDLITALEQFAMPKISDQLPSTMRSSANSSWVKLSSANSGSDEEKANVSTQVEATLGAAVATPAVAEETRAVHAEMSRITSAECPFLNRE